MNYGLIFSAIGILISIGGILVAVGVTKEKLSQEVKRSNEKLADAIKRSDDMLELMRKRVEEDRASGEGHYKELYGVLNQHGERIARLETSHDAVLKTLDEMKGDLKNGLTNIRQELRELRKV